MWASVGGSIFGTVKDPAEHVVPGAKVILRESETGLLYHARTDGRGDYTFPVVQVGTYELDVEAQGFHSYQRKGILLDTNAALAFDVALAVDDVVETVHVSDNAVHVETSSTQMGEVIGDRQLTAVPLNGRSYTDLLALQPGIVPVSSVQPNAVIMTGVTSTPPSGNANPGNLSMSGQRETSNGFRVNGSDVEEDVNMGTSILPNLDSILDFRVLTSNFDAQFGNYSGGQILVTTKSGTNRFHGNAFEFFRNTDLDARNYFSADRAKFDQNQFGGTLGGPILRDKFFFFADYQGTRLDEGIDTGLISVPSVADRAGNLSDLANTLSGTVHGQYWADRLSQQLGHTVIPGEPYYVAGCTTESQCVLPNATIPQNAWSKPAQALLKYIPQPNQGTSVFSTAASTETLRDDKGAIRLDATTHVGNLDAYYFVDDYSLNNPYPTGQGGANVPGFNALNEGRAELIALSDTTIFGANALNEFHFSFMRNANNMGQPIGGVGPSLASQGFTSGGMGIVPLAPSMEGVENVAFNDFTIGVDTTGLAQWNNIYQWSDNYSRVAGNHNFKLGGEFHLDQINNHPDVVNNGSFSFSGSETGLDFADFLLGISSSYTQGQARSFYNRNKYLGLYGQDSWRVKPNLTANYGIRWDVIAPWSEKFNQLQTLVPGEQSQVFPGAPTGLVFPGDPGVPSTLAPTRYAKFSPRVGMAYSPAMHPGWLGKLLGQPGQTSIRTGFGVYYTAYEGLSAGIMSANPPYGFTYTSAAPPLFDTPFLTAATGQSVGQPFPLPKVPYGASPSHPNNSVGWARFEPLVGIPAVDPNDTVPYAENYMLSMERQLPSKTVFKISYVGTQSHRQLVLQEANPGDPQLCLSLSQPSDVAPGSATCGPFNESSTFTSASGRVIHGTRTVFGPAFGSVELQKTIANANYNALELSLQHNSGPLEILAGYTYSKSIDQSAGLSEPVNPIDPSLSRGLSAFDLRHSFVLSYRYQLPIDTWCPGPKRLTGGWIVSGITRFSTGFPVTLYNNNDTSLLGTIPNGINNNGVDTPDFAGGSLGVHHDPRTGNLAFDTAKFNLPSLGTQGNTARRFFSGPGMENFDMAVMKQLPIAGSKSMLFRVEAFNVFNHSQFFGAAAVDGNISSSTFGRVISAASPRILQGAVKFNF
ncbi:MAG: TonB-dependent receptor domain-containing protein [Acidobacteriaceae bacterium]